MAESTNVGAVSLKLNLIANLQKQISATATKAQTMAQKSFKIVGITASKSLNDGFNASIEKQRLKIGQLAEQYKATVEQLDSKEKEVYSSRDMFPDKESYLTHQDNVLSKDKRYKALSSLAEKQKEKLYQLEESLQLDLTALQTKEINKRTLIQQKEILAQQNLEQKQVLLSEKNRQKQFKSATQGFSSLARSIKKALKPVFLMTAVYAAFQTLKTLFSGAMADSDKFSKSLNTVKANLMAAFTPIVSAVMPLLENLMAVLAKLTTRITSFIAGVFGKSYAQVMAQTKKLQKAGASPSKSKSLAGFDEINQLSSSSNAGGIDYDAVAKSGDDAASRLGEKFRETFEKLKDFFTPIGLSILGMWENSIAAFQSFYNAVAPGLNYLWQNVVLPIATWIRDTMSEAFDYIGQKYYELATWFSERSPEITLAIQNIGKVLKFVWEKFIKPILDTAKKFIGNIIDSIATIFSGFSNFLLGVFTLDIERAAKRIGNIFVGLANMVIAAAEAMLNACIDAINGLLDLFRQTKLAQWLEDKLAVSLQIPPVQFAKLPAFANGGVINQPTLGIMGEYSGAYSNPEIVAPQSLMFETFAQAIQPMLELLYQLVSQLSAGQTIHIHLDGSLSAFAKTIKPYLDTEAKRRGTKIILEV
ncbi:MAG: hypothetical protein RR198_07270 [Oscillospiraceae bacterium]